MTFIQIYTKSRHVKIATLKMFSFYDIQNLEITGIKCCEELQMCVLKIK